MSPKKPEQPNFKAWKARQATLAKIDHWEMKGRLGITTKDDSGTVSIIWKQNQRDFTMRITAPMGQGVLVLKGNDMEVNLRDGQGHSMTAASAEQLLWEQTGWDIPVRGLRQWVLGLSTYQGNALDIDGQGQLLGLQTSGWVVRYQRYKAQRYKKTRIMLPSKLQLEGTALKLKLAISQWKVF